jgi:hypothetical protein
MITMKKAIRTALINDDALVNLLGGQYVWPQRAPDANQYPRITFFEMTNFDANHADDQAYSSRMVYQIDVWSKNNPDPIAIEVDRVMKSISFSRAGAADLYEDDVQVYHRALRYGITKEVEG